jgi:hypothetical protein
MQPQATYYAIPLLLGATIAIALVMLAWQRIREPGARAFMVAMAGVALWSFAYAFEVMNTTLEGKLPWHSLIYMASAILPAFWLIFLLQQEERPKRRMRLWIGLLLIEPIVYSALTWTNDFTLPWLNEPHHLLWRTITVSREAHGLPLLRVLHPLLWTSHLPGQWDCSPDCGQCLASSPLEAAADQHDAVCAHHHGGGCGLVCVSL